MSLNCLTCSQNLQRTDSFGEFITEKEYKEVCKKVDRNWSGNLIASSSSSSSSSTSQCDLPKGQGGNVAKIKAEHRRVHSTGNIPYPGSSQPKLVRSSGMRRDWSFENLAENQDQSVSCHWDITIRSMKNCCHSAFFPHCVYLMLRLGKLVEWMYIINMVFRAPAWWRFFCTDYNSHLWFFLFSFKFILIHDSI